MKKFIIRCVNNTTCEIVLMTISAQDAGDARKRGLKKLYDNEFIRNNDRFVIVNVIPAD